MGRGVSLFSGRLQVAVAEPSVHTGQTLIFTVVFIYLNQTHCTAAE